MAESEYLDLFREIEEFLENSKLRSSEPAEDLDDRKLTGDEVVYGVSRLLEDYERALFAIPEYVQAAAKAHFRRQPRVVFTRGFETYAVLNDFLENRLVISRSVANPDFPNRVVELVEINGGSEDNPAYICYRGSGDHSIYSTQKALEDANNFLGRLNSLNT